ncbi:MAG: NUDIX hydrolase [Microthrixaceae bacterium]
MVDSTSPGWSRPALSSAAGFSVAGSRRLHEGFIIDLEQADLRDPSGELHRRDVVRHPGAVSVLPLHDDGTVTLVRQFRVAIDGDLLEVPAGKADRPDEAPASLVRRELAEEVGLAAERVELLAGCFLSPGYSDEWHEVFLATGLSAVPSAADGAEEHHLEVVRLSLSDAVAGISDGTITDAKTIIALLAAAPRDR